MNIKLFDGTVWSQKDLLDKMDDNSFYYGYLGVNCLSSSSVKKLVDGVDNYLFEDNKFDPNSKPLRDGRLIHVTILENDKLDDYYDFVDVATRRNKEYKEIKETSQKEVMLSKERLWAEDLREAIMQNSRAEELIQHGQCEVPAIGYIQGLPVRGKADCLNSDRVIDLKTTSDIDNWDYNKYFYGYDIQAYLYCELFKKDKFEFVIIDKRTKKVKTDIADDHFIKSGEEKVTKAVKNYIRYFGF